MAAKEHIELEKHDGSETTAGEDTRLNPEEPQQDLISNRNVKIVSKSSDKEERSSEPAKKDEHLAQTKKIAQASDNPSDLKASEAFSKENLAATVDAAEPPHAGENDSEPAEGNPADAAAAAPQSAEETQQPQAPPAEMTPGNPAMNSGVLGDKRTAADEKAIALENSDTTTDKASAENAKAGPVPENDETESDEADQQLISKPEEALPEQNDNADPNASPDADDDAGDLSQAGDQNTGTDQSSAGVDGKAQTGASAPTDDAGAEPSVSGDQTDSKPEAQKDNQGAPETDDNSAADAHQADRLASDEKIDAHKSPDAGDAEDRKEETVDAADEEAEPPPPDDQKSQADDASAGDDGANQPPEASGRNKSGLKIALFAILIVALFSGFFIFDNKSKIKPTKKEKPPTSENGALASKDYPRAIVDIQSSTLPSRYDGPLAEISALRDTLLKKQAEILRLKKSYQIGIEELEKEIFDELGKADPRTFLQAAENKRILFRLKTIQRRQAYIRQLEDPYTWVSEACEQLLYLKRRVTMDLLVSEVASGIDMDRHSRQMQAALQKYRPTADRLAVHPAHARLETLETIWQRILNKKDQISPERAQSRNQVISSQICRGDFNRLSELTEISAETAKCIIQLQASDLFLNRINELSPAAARQLCQWQGNWMLLNGIKALSPRVAHYLFQWGGNWISLNGLTEFPAEIGEALLKWEGRQLELMGLQSTGESHARIGVEYLAKWEQSGGKLFVPLDLRKKIDKLHRQSG